MKAFLPRHVSGEITAHLRVFPVVAITGARQTGKSTVSQRSGGDDRRRHFTLDDSATLEQALANPQAFVSGSEPMSIDEVQRVPQLMIAIKHEVDLHRVPGRFILTGSANLLLHAKISESLAGRAGYIGLWPMTQREQLGHGRCGLWQELWDAPDASWREILADSNAEPRDWRRAVRTGGMPYPALHVSNEGERMRWHRGYIDTYIERDLRDLREVGSLADFRRVMRAAALRIGGLQNQTEIARDIGVPLSTVHRHLGLLEISYQLCRVQAYTRNRTSRLMKSPKLYWVDTATALSITGETDPRGAHLENLVFADLSVWASCVAPRPEILHWRTTTGREVDFVIEHQNRVLPIEVKSATTVNYRDAAGLLAFRAEYGAESRFGLLLYGGAETYWVAPDILAAPWWAVV